MKTLRDISDIRHYFQNHPDQFCFVSATSFNLLEMHAWVKNWQSINFINCFDGNNPFVFIPEYQVSELLETGADITAFLLRQPAVIKRLTPKAGNSCQVISLFSDLAVEKAVKKIGATWIRPPYELTRYIDSKIVTTRLGERVGVPSVPAILIRAKSYEQLCEAADKAGLGRRWVIQLPYGDSGKTTFFISNKSEYQAVADQLQAEDEIKLMRQIRCRGTAIEACATRWGTFTGPLLTELIGEGCLTPYDGGWCGNEYAQSAFTPAIRQTTRDYTRHLGEQLYQDGYRGYFEVDYLIDEDTGEVYLGEINPRLSGVTFLTSHNQPARQTLPLFLFHLLEFQTDIDLLFTPDDMDNAWLVAESLQPKEKPLSQLIIKQTTPELRVLTDAPVSGVYQMQADGTLVLVQESHQPSDAMDPDTFYLLRIAVPGEYTWSGGDLCIVFFNQRVQDNSGLTTQARAHIDAITRAFDRRELTAEENARIYRYISPDSEKAS